MPPRRTRSTPRSRPLARSGARERLHEIRHHYGPGLGEEKVTLLAAIERLPIRSAARLRAWHDDLLFLRAFPDSAAVRDAAAIALRRIPARVRRLSAAQRGLLDDSGIAGSVTRHAFSLGVVQWMAEEHEQAEIAWEAIAAPERLDPLLRLVQVAAEGDAFDSGEFSTERWMQLARGSAAPSSLQWLVQPAAVLSARAANGRAPSAPHASGAPVASLAPRTPGAGVPAAAPAPSIVRLLYDSLDVPVRWAPSFERSTSGTCVPDIPLAPRAAMRATPADPAYHVATPLDAIARLSHGQALRWIAAARGALAARCREVHAISYANPDEVYLADLGEGTALCVLGAAPSERLTLEANYGYVLFANGVPVGYGGVTPLAQQANTGINVFESFRHAEAGMLFVQALRAFRTLFGVTRFVVNPYQVGADNDEALASGAYWFYDRLGFRPVAPAAHALADRERQRRSRDRAHRSSLATLRRLAAGDLVLSLPGAHDTTLFDERWLVTLATAVTESLQARDVHARLARRDALRSDVARVLGLSRARATRGSCAHGLDRLAPIVALILDEVRAWSPVERRALAALVCAKGAPQERDFALAARGHARLWAALRRYCRRRDSRATPTRRSAR